MAAVHLRSAEKETSSWQQFTDAPHDPRRGHVGGPPRPSGDGERQEQQEPSQMPAKEDNPARGNESIGRPPLTTTGRQEWGEEESNLSEVGEGEGRTSRR